MEQGRSKGRRNLPVKGRRKLPLKGGMEEGAASVAKSVVPDLEKGRKVGVGATDLEKRRGIVGVEDEDSLV